MDNTIEPTVWKTTGRVGTQSRPRTIIGELDQLSFRPHLGREAQRQDPLRRVVPELELSGVDDLDLEPGVGGCLCCKESDEPLSVKRSGQSLGARHDHGKSGPAKRYCYCTHVHAERHVIRAEMDMPGLPHLTEGSE